MAKQKTKQMTKQKNNENNKKDKNKTLDIKVTQQNGKTVVKYHSQFPQFTVIKIWLGKEEINPQDKHRLDSLPFPHVVLGNEDWERLGVDFHKYNMRLVYKADILRLLYLYENGGIYADLDTFIDYPCLLKLIEKKQGFWMAGQPWSNYHTPASTWFLYSSQKKNKKLKEVIEAIKRKVASTKPQILRSVKTVFSITGPSIIWRRDVPVINEIFRCVIHQGRGSYNRV